jgi:hypothetical protein
VGALLARAIRNVYAVVAAVIALAGGALTLYTQWPRTASASIELAATIKPGLTFGQFVDSTCLAPPCGTFAPELLRKKVVVVAVLITSISGYKGKELRMGWQLGDADGGAPITAPERVRTFRATLASDQQALEPFSLDLPTQTGRYFVEVTLVDPKAGRKVAATCTPVFEVVRDGAGVRGVGGQGEPFRCL